MELLDTSIELTRLVFITGAVLAMLYKRQTGITPGGIIVPAFLTIVLDKSFLSFVILLVIAFITRLLYKSFFEQKAFTRSWTVIINVWIATILLVAYQMITQTNTSFMAVESISFVIPGLIASNAKSYGLKEVTYGLLLITAITTIFSYVYTLIIPFKLATKLSVELSGFEPLVVGNHYLLLFFSLAVATSMRYVFGIKAGGYLILPVMLVLAMGAPLQLLAYFGTTVVCYGLVRIILHYSLIAGLERFLLCLLLSYVAVTVVDVVAVQSWQTTFYVSPIIYMTAMAVVLNDLCLRNFQTVFGNATGFLRLRSS
ncbi:hypothetical protein KA529_04820 [Candidatus Saccharibacteria bacterium]|nr:hypothetical protein [Candidatus Saccharibacteria bacterium]